MSTVRRYRGDGSVEVRARRRAAMTISTPMAAPIAFASRSSAVAVRCGSSSSCPPSMAPETTTPSRSARGQVWRAGDEREQQSVAGGEGEQGATPGGRGRRRACPLPARGRVAPVVAVGLDGEPEHDDALAVRTAELRVDDLDEPLTPA